MTLVSLGTVSQPSGWLDILVVRQSHRGTQLSRGLCPSAWREWSISCCLLLAS